MMSARFELGRTVATPGALKVLAMAGMAPAEFVLRHAMGDWGDVCEEDRRANDRALQDGSRLLSAYELPDGERLWVITEAECDGHRASTCLLRPEEY